MDTEALVVIFVGGHGASVVAEVFLSSDTGGGAPRVSQGPRRPVSTSLPRDHVREPQLLDGHRVVVAIQHHK